MKYAILRLDIMKVIKIGSKDELQNQIADFRKENIPFDVFKNHGNIWSKMEVYAWDD